MEQGQGALTDRGPGGGDIVYENHHAVRDAGRWSDRKGVRHIPPAPGGRKFGLRRRVATAHECRGNRNPGESAQTHGEESRLIETARPKAVGMKRNTHHEVGAT